MRHVLVADDHPVTRRGLKTILEDAYGDVEITEAHDANQTLERLGQRKWDLILIDILMPGPGIIDVLGRIRSSDSAVPILVVTALTEPEYILETMRAGANGVIHKHRASEDLITAIREVANGGAYLHPESAIAIAGELRQQQPASALHLKLSERELEIFRAIARGRAVKEIAGDLGLSEKTVATYIARIRDKTGLTSHVDMTRYALQHGLAE